MAITTGSEYDHFNITNGTDTVRHDLKDTKARENLIKVQASEPTEDENKVWISTNTAEIEVPTYDEFSDLKSATTETIQAETIITLTPTWTSGYVTQGGVVNPSSSYMYAEIDVKANDTIRLFRSDSGVINSARFACVYVGYSVDETLGGSNVSLPFTVPAGATKVILSILSDYTNATGTITRTIEQLQIKYKKTIDNLLTHNKINNYIYKTSDAINANETFTLINNLDVKKNTVLEFYGEFSSFNKLEICHGGSINYGSRVEITNEKVSVYYDNVATPYISEDHNLTIGDFINVRIEQGDSADCYVYVMTGSGLFKSSKSLAYHSCRGAVYAKSETAMSNVKLQYIIKDLLSNVYIFGDSYISVADPSRYPQYLIRYGYDKYLLCGFGGAHSADEIPTFRNAMAIRKPEHCIWALGMNDGDSANAINSDWKTYADEVIDYCDNNNIELILATIPNTPSINNSFKNAYVKASGKRYIDFAKCVGAESVGSSWYAGMLSSDNVHPTALGAKALCERIMLDAPELLT